MVVDFYEGILGDSRDLNEVYAVSSQAIQKFGYFECMVVQYALLCEPLEGFPRVTWEQIRAIVAVLKGKP